MTTTRHEPERDVARVEWNEIRASFAAVAGFRFRSIRASCCAKSAPPGSVQSVGIFPRKKPRISCAFNFISAATFETGLISKSGLSQEDDNERTALSVFHLVGAPATSFATIVINPSPSRAIALLA
jgi:hypothetical protein